jgi:2'-5' RNA ligase/ribosomal protein S18 acetylase RimI-like enzyme
VAEPVTIDGEVPTKGNIALRPADPDAFVVAGGDPAAALHVTVKFIGDLDGWDDEARTATEGVVAAWAARLGPVDATVTEVGPLGDEGAMVLFLDAPALVDARPELSDAVDAIARIAGADTTDKYPSFTPHLTVGYDVDPPEGMVGATVTLDAVQVQWATDVTDVPLGAVVAATKRKKDGDGDGFVDDGLPTMRPVIPGFDLDINGNPVRPKRPKGGNPQRVPADIAIKRNRVGNVDTDRLQRRRTELVDLVENRSHTLATRQNFAMRAAELTAIESELERRGELAVADRVTRVVRPEDTPFVPVDTPGEMGGEAPELSWVPNPERVTFVAADRHSTRAAAHGSDTWWHNVVPQIPREILQSVADGHIGFDESFDDLGTPSSARESAQRVLDKRYNVPTRQLTTLWDDLTRTRGARVALSKALHDGPTPEQREFYRFVHDAYLARSAMYDRVPGDLQPVHRYTNADGPFDPAPTWKERAARPDATGSGVTSWYGDDALHGHPIKWPGEDDPTYDGSRGDYAGDVPKSQVLGRFGDTRNELVVGAPGVIEAFLGGPTSPFVPSGTENVGEMGSAATPAPDDALDWKREAGDIADVPSSYEPPPDGFYNEDPADSDYVVADLTSADGAGWSEPGVEGKKVLWAKTPEGQALGYMRYTLDIDEDGDASARIDMLRTNPQFARQGVATWLTEALFALEGVDQTRVDATFTGDGASFWNKRFGTDVRPNDTVVMPKPVDVEMDDTLRSLLTQRGSRVDPDALGDAWGAAVADPDDLDAIRSAIPDEALRSWRLTYGDNATQSMRMGKGGVPSLPEVLAHNARRLTDTVPLSRDTLGANGMPSAAEIVEHDPAMAKWLGITDRARFGELRTAIARRPLANLLSDPNPPPQGVRYLQMLRRAAARDVGRMGGTVELHRTNTQGTDSAFDTKGGSGLTSWTSDFATAAKYAKGGAETVSVDIPADRILSYDTYGIMASTGFWDFSGRDSYPLPGREVLVTSPEVIERLEAGVFPLLPAADAGAAPVMAVAATLRDGDGDGFVNDGTPQMRPFNPATDLPKGRFAVGFKGQARRPKALGTVLPVKRGSKARPRDPGPADFPAMRDEVRTRKGGLAPGGKAGAARKLAEKIKGFGRFTDGDYDAALEQMIGNLDVVHRAAMDDPEFVARAKRWYPAAGTFAETIGATTGRHRDAGAGVLAVLSSSMDWDNNIYNAEAVARFWADDPEITDRLRTSAEHLVDLLNRDEDGVLKPPGRRIKLVDVPDGTQLRSGVEDRTTRAIYARVYDVVRTNGRPETLKVTLNDDGVIVPTGVTAKTRYQSTDNIAKALAILDDPTMSTLDSELGDGLKVRSFYNNIAYPNSEQADVTVDTHAGSSLIGAPYPAEDKGFKAATEAYTVEDGQLVKVMMVEAFREITRRHPDVYDHPREAQSVLWELWRQRAERSTGEDVRLKLELREAWGRLDPPPPVTPEQAAAITEEIRRSMLEWLRTPPFNGPDVGGDDV